MLQSIPLKLKLNLPNQASSDLQGSLKDMRSYFMGSLWATLVIIVHHHVFSRTNLVTNVLVLHKDLSKFQVVYKALKHLNFFDFIKYIIMLVFLSISISFIT